MSLTEVTNFLQLLTPSDVVGAEKVRRGSANDGGYVMLDLFDPAQTLFSYGADTNIEFELVFGRRGHRVHLFDPTVPAPRLYPGMTFYEEGIGPATSASPRLDTLQAHVRRLAKAKERLLLKIDVEGAEWDSLHAAPAPLLGRFEQIVLEFHDFARLHETAWRARAAAVLSKLNAQFALIHVHANNATPAMSVHGLQVLDTLECSYVRRDLVQVKPSATFYPTALDAPNDRYRPDLLLWHFPFHPNFGPGGAPLAPEVLRAEAIAIDGRQARARVRREFDEAYYLATYPDIVEAMGANPFEHYLLHGRAQGRLLAPIQRPRPAIIDPFS